MGRWGGERRWSRSDPLLRKLSLLPSRVLLPQPRLGVQLLPGLFQRRRGHEPLPLLSLTGPEPLLSRRG